VPPSLTASGSPSVVIAGNPNTGKSTLFNQLTGSRARVGNYPGITVERSEGRLRLPAGRDVAVLDSPGTYSLVARSPEEELSLESIAGLPPLARPDLVVVTVDATQLARNLYLVLQIIELDVPVVVALNMVDALAESGQTVDVDAVSDALGVPVIPVIARRGEGIDALVAAVDRTLADPETARPGWRWQPAGADLEADIAAVSAQVPESWHGGSGPRRRALALWALLSLAEAHTLENIPAGLADAVRVRRAAARAAGRDLEREIIGGRYGWIDARADRFLELRPAAVSITDRIDRVMLHPVLGFALFLGLMTVVFQALFTGADPLIGFIEDTIAVIGEGATNVFGDGMVGDFVVNGLIEGVGAFLVFLPQILLLFLFIGILEDCGYMSRVAVLMDRIMKRLGLHGRAFVPLLSGYACAVPAIMATRTMERRRDRMITILALPLMTCSARLPVYGLLIAAIAPPWEESRFVQGLLMAAMYVFGTVMALIVAWVLGRTVLRGRNVPLIIEMPPYRMPHWPTLLHTVLRRGGDFIKTAGTIILVASVAMWALLSFPRTSPAEQAVETRLEATEAALATAGPAQAADLAEQRRRLERDAAAAQAQNSYAGRIGRWIEPAIEPLGFDWKIGIGIVGAFAAREVFVSTMGVVFGVGEVEDDTRSLREKMWADTWPDGRRVFTPLVCLSLMVFFALACQCMSTLAVVRRETGNWLWPGFMFAYMTVLAWAASFAVFQGGRLLGFS
jgi:ferrous iron transport protein B